MVHSSLLDKEFGVWFSCDTDKRIHKKGKKTRKTKINRIIEIIARTGFVITSRIFSYKSSERKK